MKFIAVVCVPKYSIVTLKCCNLCLGMHAHEGYSSLSVCPDSSARLRCVCKKLNLALNTDYCLHNL